MAKESIHPDQSQIRESYLKTVSLLQHIFHGEPDAVSLYELLARGWTVPYTEISEKELSERHQVGKEHCLLLTLINVRDGS